MKPLRPDEEWARAVMERALGVPVVRHDDGSRPAMYDLQVLYPDREACAAEVVAAADPQAIALWKLINPAGERWVVPDLQGGWSVLVELTARAKQLRAELPSLLRLLESAAATTLEPRFADEPLAEMARELGVVHAHQGETDFPGSIYPSIDLPPERTGGGVPDTGDELAEWIADFLKQPAQADVRLKLGSSGAAERHAFVWIASLGPVPFAVTDLLIRDDAPRPCIDPTLPEEVTDAWIMSSWSTGCGFRWSAASGWLTFDKSVETNVEQR